MLLQSGMLSLFPHLHCTQSPKPKIFDLDHQTIFLTRGVVWARDYVVYSICNFMSDKFV